MAFRDAFYAVSVLLDEPDEFIRETVGARFLEQVRAMPREERARLIARNLARIDLDAKQAVHE